MSMDEYLIDFVTQNKTEINSNDLRESLLLHMICLYDYEQINKSIILKAIEVLDKKLD